MWNHPGTQATCMKIFSKLIGLIFPNGINFGARSYQRLMKQFLMD